MRGKGELEGAAPLKLPYPHWNKDGLDAKARTYCRIAAAPARIERSRGSHGRDTGCSRAPGRAADACAGVRQLHRSWPGQQSPERDVAGDTHDVWHADRCFEHPADREYGRLDLRECE